MARLFWLLLLILGVFCEKSADSDLLSLLNEYKVVWIQSDQFSSGLHLQQSTESAVNSKWKGTDQFEFTFNAFDQEFTAQATLNTELFSPSYREERITFTNGGKTKITTSKGLHEIEHCHYKMTVLSSNRTQRGMGALSFCSSFGGLKGLLSVGNEVYGIEPAHTVLDQTEINSHVRSLQSTQTKRLHPNALHVVYRTSDLKRHDRTKFACGVDHANIHHIHHHQPRHSSSATTPSTSSPHDIINNVFHDLPTNNEGKVMLKSSYIKNSGNKKSLFAGQTQYVELVVVNDATRYNMTKANTEIASNAIVNLVNNLYITNSFNPPVQVILVSQLTFIAGDPNELLDPSIYGCTNCAPGEVGVSEYLNAFNTWRNSPQAISVPYDNAHLFSGHKFEQTVLGYAYVGEMCTKALSCGIEQIIPTGFPYGNTQGVHAATVAHEMGHNFGMSHDGQGANIDPVNCPASGFIMNSIINLALQPPTNFSLCSMNAYQSEFVNTNPQCLLNQPTRRWADTAVCGNGFIETGETCDCGPQSLCDTTDPCCDASTCQLKTTALCSVGDACCTANCTFKPAETPCRAAANDCDLEEKCTGSSGQCPPNDYKGAGMSCTDPNYGAGLCYAGTCSTYNEACDTIARQAGYGYDESWEKCSTSTAKQPAGFPGDTTCGIITCQDTQGTWGCLVFNDTRNTNGSIDNYYAPVPDGVPCPLDNSQCLNYKCASSSDLNKYDFWVAGPWSNPDCKCGESQTRTVVCQERPSTGPSIVVDDYRCSANQKPARTRQCIGPPDNQCKPNENGLSNYASSVALKYGAVEKAAKLRNFVGPHPPFNYTDPNYWNAIKQLSVPGIFLGVLSLVLLSLFALLRDKCDCFKPKKEGYSALARWLPMALMAVFWFMVVPWICVGLYFNTEVRRGATDDTTGITVLMVQTLEDMTDLSRSLLLPLEYLNNTASTVVNDASTTLQNDVPIISAGVNPLLASINAFNSTYDAAKVTNTSTLVNGTASQTVTFICGICANFSNAVGPVSQQINSTAGPPMRNLSDALSTVQSSVNELRDVVTNDPHINEVHAEISHVYDNLVDNRPEVFTYRDKIKQGDSLRYPFTVFLYVIPLIAVGAFIVVAFMKQGMVFISVLTGVTLVTMWIYFGIHLPIATIFSDTCVYMDQGEANPEVSFNLTANEAAVFKACLINSSMVAALNLSSQFSFVDELTFPHLDPIANSFSFPQLIAFNDQVQKINLSDYGYNQTYLDTQFEALNNQTNGTVYTEANISTFIPANNSQGQLKVDIIAYFGARNQATAQIAAMKVASQALVNQSTALQTTAVGIENDYSLIQTKLDPLIVQGNAFLDLAYCGQIGDEYKQMKTTWCVTLYTALAFMALSMLIIAGLATFLVGFAIYEEKRLSHPTGMPTQEDGIALSVQNEGQRGPSSSRAASPSRGAASSRAASPSHPHGHHNTQQTQ